MRLTGRCYVTNQMEQLQLIKTETLIESFDRNISKIDINQLTVSKIISKLEKEKNRLKKQITSLTRHNNDIVTNIHNTVNEVCKRIRF